jgi:lysophospholipase L1-like esterase
MSGVPFWLRAALASAGTVVLFVVALVQLPSLWDNNGARPGDKPRRRHIAAGIGCLLLVGLTIVWAHYDQWVLLGITSAELLLVLCVWPLKSRRVADVLATAGAEVAAVALIVFLYLLAPIFGASSQQADSGNGSAGIPVVAPVHLPAQYPLYVALGDSFSAGEGLGPPYISPTDNLGPGGNGCHQSSEAYPEQISIESPHRPVFQACSGATRDALQGPQTTQNGGVHPPQVQGVDWSHTGLVTITMGGNDLKFADVVFLCFLHSHCLGHRFGGTTLSQWVSGLTRTVQGELTTQYQLIRSYVPTGARVLVVGYPNLFPLHPPSDWVTVLRGDLNLQDANADCEYAAFSDRASLLWLEARLDATIRDAALAAGVEFVPTTDVFKGHEPCGPDNPRWIRYPSFDPDRGLYDGSMHPTRAGQQVLARTVECYLHLVPHANAPYSEPDLVACARHGKLPKGQHAS